MGLSDTWDETYLQKYKPKENEELPWNQSMYLWLNVKSQKLSSSPRPSTSLQGHKIRMSGLDMAHWQFSNTPEDKFQDQWTLIQ